MKTILKSAVPHLISLLAFLTIASAYFYPAWDGKSLQGEDVIGSYGAQREKKNYEYFENETGLWNGGIFSGMPDLISAHFNGSHELNQLYMTIRKFRVPHEVASIIWYMIGFYILLLTLGLKPYISAGGAVAFSLSTYYIIIIMAGHYMKVDTLAMIPPTLAGVLLCFKRKYLWGFILTAFPLAIQISMAHIQMMYYFLITLIILGLVELYFHIKEKKIKQFVISALVLVAAAILAIAPNAAKLITFYTYNDYSIRGKSELTIGQPENATASTGLDKDYINAWSSGVDEAMMIIVPNVKGGATSMVKQNRDLLNRAPRQYRETIGSMNQYWGNQPFSGGPNYLGIIFVFLFVLGAFVIPGRLKYAALFPVILFFFLSMGGNLSFFTNLFIDYVPMYNKFRAPVSILAVGAIWIGLLALFTLYKIYRDPTILENKNKIPFTNKEYPSYLLVSSLFLIFLVINIAAPNLFNSYLSDAEISQFASLRSQQNMGNQLDALIGAITDFRIDVFRADLWRSVFFVVAVTGLIFFYKKGKLNKNLLAGAIILLAIVDFWGVSRRYVPLDHFTKRGAAVQQAHALTDVDRQIYSLEMAANPLIGKEIQKLTEEFKPKNKQEEDRILTHAVNKTNHYRVFNLTNTPFQENVTSNAHNSIGGYHAVKLRRYQDMIEQHIGKMNMSVINMLDTKYIITQNGLQRNTGAMGNAWFVDSVKWVDNANDEILALNDIDVRNTAVIRDENKKFVSEFSNSGEGYIELTQYSPDNLIYSSKTSTQQLAVFSEVFFQYWSVFVDGKETNVFPVNYILRGMMVPEGEHTIEFKFHPNYFYRWNLISKISYYLLIVLVIVGIVYEIYSNRITLKELLQTKG
ncbi:YfhO family protein [uncultured Draconibacterium sp.]|uniref:YfhO family protein n=1 Tax=uncultured Draconibacterium sp. TaxID=1573823 RepID=UPI0032171F06